MPKSMLQNLQKQLKTFNKKNKPLGANIMQTEIRKNIQAIADETFIVDSS